MDKAEFTERVSVCGNALKRYAYYRLPTKADAEDIFQETLLTAYLQRNMLKNANGFKPWILRIAANKCNDFYRKYMKRQESPIESDAVLENALSQSRYGLTVAHTVRETLAQLNQNIC
ncbi:MAG: RNA polymerase sigma factor [Firmicutes bacterium]|nr:RNA polymerase sigma factor [Bacillota bacterium]